VVLRLARRPIDGTVGGLPNRRQLKKCILFIPLVVVPQVFFSGLFNLDTMEEWLRSLSVIMPLTYGADALRDIMVRGEGFRAIAVDVYVLLGFTLLFMIFNVVALKKYRKL